MQSRGGRFACAQNSLLTFTIKSARVTSAAKRRDRAWLAGTMGMAITAIAIAAFCHALEGARFLTGTRLPEGGRIYYV